MQQKYTATYKSTHCNQSTQYHTNHTMQQKYTVKYKSTQCNKNTQYHKKNATKVHSIKHTLQNKYKIQIKYHTTNTMQNNYMISQNTAQCHMTNIWLCRPPHNAINTCSQRPPHNAINTCSQRPPHNAINMLCTLPNTKHQNNITKQQNQK